MPGPTTRNMPREIAERWQITADRKPYNNNSDDGFDAVSGAKRAQFEIGKKPSKFWH